MLFIEYYTQQLRTQVFSGAHKTFVKIEDMLAHKKASVYFIQNIFSDHNGVEFEIIKKKKNYVYLWIKPDTLSQTLLNNSMCTRY